MRGARVKGEKAVAGAATGAATGEVLGPDAPAERDTDGFMDRLRDFASGCGVEAMSADDLSACKPVVRRLGLERQTRLARVKKRARNRLDKIDG